MANVARTLALLSLGLLLGMPGEIHAQAAAPAAAGSADLQKVIAELNAAALKFTSAQADFSWNQYQAVVQESDVQAGTIYFERKKGSTRTAADFATENGKPSPKTVVYDGGEVNFYQPAIKQITVLRAGANRGQWESFLTLGFGGSGTDLEANWKVTLQGTEKMDGVSVVKLDLVPIQAKVLELFTHVTIWVDPTRGVSLKQIFYEPGGDMRTATYANIRYNQPIAGDVFKIAAAPGTTRVVK
jgi:outer membrane lipoprotein-sorting protein